MRHSSDPAMTGRRSVSAVWWIPPSNHIVRKRSRRPPQRDDLPLQVATGHSDPRAGPPAPSIRWQIVIDAGPIAADALRGSGQTARFWVGERPPPSATRTAPVTKDASSDARNRQQAAISEEAAIRPRAIRRSTDADSCAAVVPFASASNRISWSLIGVRTHPGAIAFARIPSAPPAYARDRV